MSQKYLIFTGDYFHMFDEEDDLSSFGQYSTEKEAITAAKEIVNNSLRLERSECNDPSDPDELYEHYTDFGNSPIIRPDTDPPFLALDYAKIRCAEICKEEVSNWRMIIN